MPRVEVFNREQVLKQMVDVFHQKGYNATSMQDLVDATDLNRSSIYNSFGNKLSIFLECLKVYQEDAKRDASSILLKSDNALHAIESFFDEYLKNIMKDSNNRGCLLSNCTSEMANQEEQITRFLNHNQKSMITLFSDLIVEGQKQGHLNTDQTAKAYALFLFSSLQGLRTTSILLRNKQELKSVINIILNKLK